MDYIEYRKEGNKTSDPQYIPGCEWSSTRRKNYRSYIN